jgi:hypothetical protein
VGNYCKLEDTLMKEDPQEDILTDIKPLSHYERYPKAKIGLLVIYNILIAIIVLASIRAVYLYFMR